MLTKNLLTQIIRKCRARKKIVIIDPKDKDFSIYANANIITPNQKELFEAIEPDSIASDHSVEKLSKKIIKLYGFDAVITTRSSDGISLVIKILKYFIYHQELKKFLMFLEQVILWCHI